MESGKICLTCHWWFQQSICVWHNGLKGSKEARIDFGGTKPFTTHPMFGCVDWTLDKREHKEPINADPDVSD